ncbi:hypothetical protein FRB90_003884, partial [Tulasnella sp. 427]
MPYTPPGSLTAADRNLSSERNHHRSRSFTDEKGPGAFAPLSGVPRRNARPGIPKLTMPGGPPPSSSSTATTSASVATPPPVVKSPKFELHTGSSEDSEEDEEEAAAAAVIHNPLASKVISHGTSSPTVHGHADPLPRSIPFPSVRSSPGLMITAPSPGGIQRIHSSPQIASPSTDQPSPSIYRSPYSSLRGEPNTREKVPLKPALKSNHSSPHLPSLAHQRALTQSAPSTPNLQMTAWASSGASTPVSPGSNYLSCNYSASLPNIPPPFSSSSSPFTPGHSRSATISGLPTSGSSSHLPISNGKAESWDRFTFTIKLEDVERTLPNKRMFLVVKYQVPSQWGWESGGEWWDNNNGKNYEFGFKMDRKATINSSPLAEGGPSALAARTSASVIRGHEDLPAARTQSLPPLPPPGPVRATASPLTVSPVNSVLGLSKIKPSLPPIVSSGPKLRAGRGPTFTDVPSPRGSPPGSPVTRNSPTRSTNYTSPLPGTVPGITHGVTSPSLAGLERPIPQPVAEITPTTTPAPTSTVPAPVAQPPKLQGLTISTVDLSPTGTVGKKRGLSLSNYVSPTMVKSPSSMSINNATMQNLASLMGKGGDGGENAYANSKPSPPYVYTPPSSIGRKDSQNGPLTPGSLRMVGGMPATIIDENGSAPVERVPSWDIPLNGFWSALGQQKPIDKKAANDSDDSSSSEDQIALPTPPESSGDSTLSTPDLERSPEAENVTFDEESRRDTEADRDTPTPTLVSSTSAGPVSTVPFPRSSPNGSPRSSDGGNTVRHASPELPTPQYSDAESKPPSLSNLGRRTSLQTGQTMRL